MSGYARDELIGQLTRLLYANNGQIQRAAGPISIACGFAVANWKHALSLVRWHDHRTDH